MAGRPTEFREEFCDMLIKHMSTGLSFESFAAVINVARSSIYKWVVDYPQFSDAKNEAFEKNLLFWEKESLEGLWGNPDKGNFNTTLWIFTMKNRHKWTDRVAVTETEDKPTGLEKVSDEELDDL